MTPLSIQLRDPSRPNWLAPDEPRPVPARIWPSPGTAAAPVVLLSHGTGGAGQDLDWIAQPLTEAGFLVASPDHHGNSYTGDYLVEGFTRPWERPRDLTLLLDHLVAEYNVDAHRVGGIGFSFGGYSIAGLLGARLDGQILRAVLQGAVPAPHVPEFPDMIPTLRSKYSDAELIDVADEGSRSVFDPRIRAGVLLAPALGSMLIAESLREVTAPVLVRWGDADDNTPPAENGHLYRDLMPFARGETVGRDVGHYVFLGSSEDPTGVRPRVAAESVQFFMQHL